MPSPLLLPQTVLVAMVGPTGPVLAEQAPTERVEAAAPADTPASKERRCARRWRLIHAGAQAADVATTVIGLSDKNAVEANPVIRKLFGERPKAHELIAFKAANFGVMELAGRATGNVCRAHKVGAVITGAVALINLRVIIK